MGRTVYEILGLCKIRNQSTDARLDIHKSTFYNWLGRYHEGGFGALEDKKPQPSLASNKVPADHREALIDFALRETDLSPRGLALRYTDEQSYFVSESTIYRVVKTRDLITSHAYILMKAAAKFKHPSRRVNELWQTHFTYFKIVGWAGITYRQTWMITLVSLLDAVCA